MAITTMDQIAAGLAAAPVIDLFAPSATNVAAGFVNLQRAVVTSTGQMAVPAAASAGARAGAAARGPPCRGRRSPGARRRPRPRPAGRR